MSQGNLLLAVLTVYCISLEFTFCHRFQCKEKLFKECGGVQKSSMEHCQRKYVKLQKHTPRWCGFPSVKVPFTHPKHPSFTSYVRTRRGWIRRIWKIQNFFECTNAIFWACASCFKYTHSVPIFRVFAHSLGKFLLILSVIANLLVDWKMDFFKTTDTAPNIFSSTEYCMVGKIQGFKLSRIVKKQAI